MSKNKSESMYSVAELFCGCGGLSHGFVRTGRFKAILGNDIKKLALTTFRINHAYGDVEPATIERDIRTITDREIANLLTAKGVSELDCLLGGPPCQGFSQMRRSEARKDSSITRFGGYNKLDQDSRNDLVLRFLEIAAALRPKVIVIENVPQFLSHYHDGKRGGIAQQVEEILSELGYEVSCSVLNSADFGVPQLRQRAFIVASRLGKFKFPDPSHGDPDSLAPGKKKAWITVKDAIADLPADPPKHDTLGGQSGCYVGMPPSAFAKRMRTSKKFPYNHITRSYDKRIIAIIKEMKEGETWDEGSARVRARYERLIRKSLRNSETGRDARDRLIDEGKIIEAFYKRYYWSAYTRLALERPALTITANSNFLGSGRFTHPLKDRGITMREAARLQSFDDAFTFVTSEKRGAETETIGIGLDMIGEAVPPLLAEAIAAEIAVHLDERRN